MPGLGASLPSWQTPLMDPIYTLLLRPISESALDSIRAAQSLIGTGWEDVAHLPSSAQRDAVLETIVLNQ